MQRIVLWLTHSIIGYTFLRFYVGVKFSRCRALSDEKQFIIVANHNSHLDTMAILASLPWNVLWKVRPVAAADHFGKTKLKAALTNYFINALLIPRKRDKDNPENDPIHKMVKAIDEGYSLLIFPEGTRGSAEVSQPLKPGVAMVLTKKPHVKYVPAYMKGMGKAMPKHDSLIVPHSASLIFGDARTTQGMEITDILEIMQHDLDELKTR